MVLLFVMLFNVDTKAADDIVEGYFSPTVYVNISSLEEFTSDVTFELYKTTSSFDIDGRTPIETITVTKSDIDNKKGITFTQDIYRSIGHRYYVVKYVGTSEGDWTPDNKYAYIEVAVTGEQVVGSSTMTMNVYEIQYAYEISGSSLVNMRKEFWVNTIKLSFSLTKNEAKVPDEEVQFGATSTVINGNTWTDGATFTYKLEALDSSNCGVGNWVSAKAPLPGDVAGPIVMEANKDNPIAYFGKVSFSYDAPAGHIEQSSINEGEANTRCYMYKITEVIPDEANESNNYTVNGVKYDKDAETLYVKVWVIQVVNSLTGEKSVKTDTSFSTRLDAHIGGRYDISRIEFTHEYVASGSISLGGNVSLTGKRIESGNFAFRITAPAGTPIPSYTTVYNDESGKFDFGEIKYTSSDVGKTYSYTVIEDVPADSKGIVFDSSEYTINVSVTDRGDGTLACTSTIKRRDGTPVENVTFRNVYYAQGSIVIDGIVNLTGKMLEGDEFTFELLDEAGSVISKVKNQLGGHFGFDTITYRTEDIGTHTYTIRQVIPASADGTTYDQSKYTISVEVMDNGDGTLAPSVAAIRKDGVLVERISFANKKKAAKTGYIDFLGTVNYTKAISSGLFTTALKKRGDTKSYLYNVSSSGAVKYNHTSSVLGILNFTSADIGNHVFEISQKKGSESDIEYDTSVYVIYVTVSDTAGDSLDVKVTKVIKAVSAGSDIGSEVNFSNGNYFEFNNKFIDLQEYFNIYSE